MSNTNVSIIYPLLWWNNLMIIRPILQARPSSCDPGLRRPLQGARRAGLRRGPSGPGDPAGKAWDLVGGDWLPWILFFPEILGIWNKMILFHIISISYDGLGWYIGKNMEFHHPNWRTPSFFRGVAQPPSSMGCSREITESLKSFNRWWEQDGEWWSDEWWISIQHQSWCVFKVEKV